MSADGFPQGATMIHVNEYIWRNKVPAQRMDFFWSLGWRHLGRDFFRYSQAMHADGRVYDVMPLRVALSRFAPSRSQKRVLAKNRDVEVLIRASTIDAGREAMFQRHKQRFRENVPDSLYDFLSETPASAPCKNHEICVYQDDRLLAVSYLDIGREATSGVYAMFEPAESARSLGIFCILQSIRYSQTLGCRYYYPGYAYRQPSVYDYKKNLAAIEYLDWQAYDETLNPVLSWKPFRREMMTSGGAQAAAAD
ncbi:MAG: arginine-tRNA-protein transferase [Blastocatellia bacterium]